MSPHAETRTTHVEDLLVHADWLRHLASRLVHEGDADDVVQETWMAAMRTPPRADAATARPWLAEVMRNFARRRWRAREIDRRLVATLALPEGRASMPATDEVLARARLQRQLADLVLHLEEPYRTAVLLRYHEGKTAADIATSLGIPAGTVRWRLSEGLERLRQALDREHGDRQRWRALLTPLLPLRRAPAAPAIAGAAAGAQFSRTAAVGGASVVLVAIVASMVVIRIRRHAQDQAFEIAAARAPLRAHTFLSSEGLPSNTTITGRVRDPAGQPVAGAVVVLSRARTAQVYARVQPSGTARTDDAGLFQFDNAVPGTFRISASAPGFMAALSGGFLVAENARVTVDLELRAGGATLRGRVLDDGGGAIPGARVTATLGYPWNMVVSPDLPLRIFETVAGEEGSYQLTLESREYQLNIEADGYAGLETSVALTRDAVRDLRLAPAAKVFGTVIEAATGRPVADATVTWGNRDVRAWTRSMSTKTDAEGRFGFDDLHAGTYQIMARAPARGLSGKGPTFTAESLKTVSGIRIAMEPSTSLAGVVVDEAGRGVEGVSVALTASLRDTALPRLFVPVFSDSQGRFAFFSVEAGRYELSAGGFDSLARAFVTVGAEGRLEGKSEVRLVIDQPRSLAMATGCVRATDGQPAPGALVRVEGTDGKAVDIQPVETDEGGRFRLRGLRATSLVLIAWHPGLGVGRVPFTAPADRQTITVDVRLAPAATIAGIVKYDDGSPAADVSVAATRPQGTVFYDSATTDAGGRFVISNLAEGTYSVNARRTEGPLNLWTTTEMPWLKLIRVGPEEARNDVVLTLKRGGKAIAGVVVTNDGSPAVGVRVLANPETDGRSWKPGPRDMAFSATSDLSGRFHFADLDDASAYSLWGTRPGQPDGELLHVSTGRNDVRLVLPSAASVAGVVVDARGKPVSRYQLKVLPVADPKDRDQTFRRMLADEAPPNDVIDPGGAFRTEGLAAGRFELAVRAAEGGIITPIELGAGEVKEGLRLVLGPATKVRGKVVRFDDGAPLSGMVVDLTIAGQRASVRTAGDGGFEFGGLQPGEKVRIDARDYDDQHVGEWVERQAAQDGTPLDVGVIRLIDGKPTKMSRERGTLGLAPKPQGDGFILGPVTPNSPAARAGALAGDVVLSIGDREARGLGPNAATYLMQRRPGETLTVRLQTPGAAPRTVSMVALPRVPSN
jgi:RNA polymerase sigma-70 factor (ECF subfamily)